ncbi:MAG: CFI-box-CTERM domain-containing protein [Dehalococcoidia bacterium]
MSRHMRVMLATLLIVTGVLVFLPSSYVSAGGWVVNGGFEYGTDEIPYGWNLTGNATRTNTGPIYTGNAGNWTANITADGQMLTQWVGNITMLITTCDAWGWMYVSGNVTGVIAFDFWQGENGIPLGPTTMLSATDTHGAYVQMTGTLKPPPDVTHVRIRLFGTDWNGSAEVRFDEIGFYPNWPSVPGVNCFIATAAYGTETASQLDILRDFRDQVLLKSALGSRFVATYYRLSPPVAAFIAKNDFLRAVVREVLVDPVVKLLQWSQDLWRAQPNIP